MKMEIYNILYDLLYRISVNNAFSEIKHLFIPSSCRFMPMNMHELGMNRAWTAHEATMTVGIKAWNMGLNFPNFMGVARENLLWFEHEHGHVHVPEPCTIFAWSWHKMTGGQRAGYMFYGQKMLEIQKMICTKTISPHQLETKIVAACSAAERWWYLWWWVTRGWWPNIL